MTRAFGREESFLVLFLVATLVFVGCVGDDNDKPPVGGHDGGMDAGSGPDSATDATSGVDANCSFERWCTRLDSGVFYCSAKDGVRNPCCPAVIQPLQWRGCKAGIDASVVFSEGCAPPGWYHCDGGTPRLDLGR